MPGLVDFFRNNPVVGMITTIATLISIPLSLVLYFQGRATRDVVYAVYPLRTYLARAERPTNLRVEFKGQTITGSDVIAVQIGIWNQGKMSIRPENVLEPLELVLIPPAAVLQSSS